MDNLTEFIAKFNRLYHEVAGRPPAEDAWIWAHALGTVLSEWSEDNYSCGWCEEVIQERLRRARRNVKYGGADDAPLTDDDYLFAALYDRTGHVMVTFDDFGAALETQYVPIAWDENGGI